MTEREIFIAALQKEDAADRQAYLDEACSGRPELRRQLQELLRFHEGAGGFLEKSPAVSIPTGAFPEAAEATTAEAPGAVIGPYKLVERIGEGGMGTVWMAQQTEPVKRLVAVKLIKAGMDSRQVIARFEAERQALALMDHPNIARVLDAGTAGAGRPYFVMDLVKGVPLTRYCDEHHLTPRQRLELFVPVCQAVQHAHQKGIIHRDLKPSNVLVALYDGRPVPKVIDFGVAKAAGQSLTDKTLVTGFGAIVGTLEYMSPEQAEINQLDIDTRSDIYSLGAVLYELLTGGPPFSRKELETAGLLEMLRVIREREPARPSTKISTADGLPALAARRGMEPKRLAALVRGELDWIVMKALEKDRNRRYETANSLAMDLQRYLADEPVQACPPTMGYRIRKFTRKNRKLLVIGAAFTSLVLLAAVVSSWQWWRAERHARAERDERERAEKKSLEAAENARQTREAIKKSFTRLSETTLLNQPGLTPLRKQLLQDAREFYEHFLQQSRNDPELEVELAASYLRLCTINISLDRNDDALAAIVKGLELVEKLLRERPGDLEFPKQLAGYFQYRSVLGESTRPPSDPPGVLAALRNSTAIWERFARDDPQVLGFRSDLAGQYMLLGMMQQELGRREDALASYQKVRTLSEELIRARHEIDAYQALFLDSSLYAGSVLDSLRRTGESSKLRRLAVESFQKLAADLPSSPGVRVHLARACSEWAKELRAADKLDEVEKAYRQAIEGLEKLEREASGTADSRLELSAAYGSLADLLGRTGRDREAEEVLRTAVAIDEKLVADFPNSPAYRVSLAERSRSIADRRKETQPADAEQLYRRAFAVQEKLVVDFPNVERYRAEWPRSQERLVDVLRERGRFQEIEGVYRQTIACCEKLAAAFPDTPDYRRELARNHNRLGLHLRQAGRGREAEGELEKSKEHWRAGLDPAVAERKRAAEAEPGIPGRWVQLGVAYYRAGDWEAVLQIFPAKVNGGAWQWFYMAIAHVQLGHKALARYWYFQSLDWMALAREDKLRDMQAEAAAVLGLPDPGHRPRRASDLSEEGAAYEKQGDRERAKESYNRAIDLYAKLATDFPGVPTYHSQLIALLNKAGRQREAEEIYAKTTASLERLAADAPENPEYRASLAQLVWQRAQSLRDAGRLKEAEPVLRRSIAEWEKLANEHAEERDYVRQAAYAAAYVRWALAADFMAQQRLPEADETYRQALADWQKLVDLFPKMPWYRHELAYNLDTLGWLWEATAPAKAEPYFRQALDHHEKLVAENPADVDNRQRLARTRTRLAQVLTRTGRLPEAEKARRGALDVLEPLAAEFPANADYQGQLAAHYDALDRALTSAHRVPEALDVRRRAEKAQTRAVELDPMNARLRIRRAFFYQQLCRFDQAISDYSRATELDPKAAGAWNDLAWLLATCPEDKYRDAGKAVAFARKATELTPKDGTVWNTLGAAHYRAGDWKDAVAAFVKSMEFRDGGDSFDWFFLAMAHERLGKTELARKWHGLAVRWMAAKNPKDEELLRFRAEAGEVIGVGAEAAGPPPPAPPELLEVYALILETDAAAASARARRGELYALAGNWDPARADYARAAESGSDNVAGVWLPLALLDLRTGRTDDYRALCEDLLKRCEQANDPGTAFWTIVTCKLAPNAVRDRAQLVRLAEKHQASDPGNAHATGLLGDVLYRAGEPRAAAEKLEAGIRGDPGVGRNWRKLFLAMACHHLGRTAEAESNFREVEAWTGTKEFEQLPWTQRLDLELLREEAQLTLGLHGKKN
jgi:serine/threonine protein kinase/tetratricopeptide (TPR) repeat protein